MCLIQCLSRINIRCQNRISLGITISHDVYYRVSIEA